MGALEAENHSGWSLSNERRVAEAGLEPEYQVRADGNSNSKDFAVYPTQSPW